MRDNETGVLFGEPTPAALADALGRVAALRVDRGAIRRHAEQFSRERHMTAMRGVIDEVLAAPAGTTW
jgi:hypothetical protein